MTTSDEFKAACGEIAGQMAEIAASRSVAAADRIAAARLRFEVLSGLEMERMQREREDERRRQVEEWKAANPLEATRMGPFGYPIG